MKPAQLISGLFRPRWSEGRREKASQKQPLPIAGEGVVVLLSHIFLAGRQSAC